MPPAGLVEPRSPTLVSNLLAGHDDDYPGAPPYRFSGGTLKRVAVDVSGEPYVDLEREAAALIMRE